MNILDTIIKDINRAIESNLERAFLCCGYTKDYIMQHRDEFEVTMEIGSERKLYSHLGKPLFYEQTTFRDSSYVIEYIFCEEA